MCMYPGGLSGWRGAEFVFPSEPTRIFVWGQSGNCMGSGGTLAAAPMGEGSCPCIHPGHVGTPCGHAVPRLRVRTARSSTKKAPLENEGNCPKTHDFRQRGPVRVLRESACCISFILCIYIYICESFVDHTRTCWRMLTNVDSRPHRWGRLSTFVNNRQQVLVWAAKFSYGAHM